MENNEKKAFLEDLDQTLSSVEQNYTKEEIKTAKKTSKSRDFSHFENKIMSQREQQLLVQSYFKSKFLKDMGKLVLAAFIITIAFDYFISVTGRSGLFPAGLGAMARFLAILTFSDNVALQSSFYFIYYFIINIPLFIFGFLKLGKKFTITTFIFVLIQICFDQTAQVIPYINPTQFHFIVNYQLLHQIPNSWNAGIWLFVFGVIGGILLGVSYSMVYKIGSSTGGFDFISMYWSKKKNKSIGSINRNVNFVILGIVITLNTTILPMEMINADIKNNILNNIGLDEAMNGYYSSDNYSLLESMLRYALTNNRGAILNGRLDSVFAANMGIYNYDNMNQYYGDHRWEELLTQILKNFETKTISGEQYPFDVNAAYKYLCEYVSKIGYGETLPLGLKVLAKLGFIFGPSLFASIGLVLAASITTNALYPKYKVRTYLITTNKPKEINKLLLDKGYQNDIVTWDGTNRINHNYLHRSVIMVAMSILNWDLMEKDIFLIDPGVKINVIKTKVVKGLFNYDVKQNDERDIILRKIKSDESEIEKIRQIAIVRYNKDQKKSSRKIVKKSKKNQ
ncbi:hypothetical protein SHELI_v1c03920 [Spiroplasma helicoides]|uniref:YitT family protein n=1 Tax=Spiroplasma helicoides TaxID=216938 RepID=A0A1B3SK85_9MOLU|nr:YitT family ABC transporter [Spiroplasma helicoides]AOG60343.1 hypothetical protein SHELI_v1c03920 [Spiroplasma helicoides]